MRKLLLLGMTATALITGCGKADDNLAELEGKEISFTSFLTKAPVTGISGLQDFSIWGWRYKDATAYYNVFDAETAHADGSYDGGPRYWFDGFTYDFYAVHPSAGSLNASNVLLLDAGLLTIDDFDASVTGADVQDLMTTSATGIVQTITQTANPDKVALNFKHELAKVKFSVTAAEDVTVTSQIGNIVTKGSFSKDWKKGTANWVPATYSSSVSNPYHYSEKLVSPKLSTVLFNGEMLMIPQVLDQKQDALPVLEFSYKYPDDQIRKQIILSEIKDKTGKKITAWEAGKSYNYSIQVPENKVGVKVTVIVADWNYKDVSVTL